ncbi:MAG: lytic transglycosylase domain-containing protein [Deltaproteobacteria bacterium]|nr:lytic transglycosylase domain-containing protein [Deltaproteobacteria bacterium]
MLILAAEGPAFGDIYRYKDEQGVWHFTNIKSDRRYKLYIREYPERPAEYIKKYEGIIRQACREFNVEPLFVKAVIRAESGFDRRAVSRKGAKGLMQLMPETAEAMDVGDPFNPEENIFGGTRYLGLLLERYDYDKKLALAAYNAGPEAIEKYKGIPPFPETIAFINRVMEYYEKSKRRPSGPITE